MEKACTGLDVVATGPHGPHKVGLRRTPPQRALGPICPLTTAYQHLTVGTLAPAKWIGDGHLFENGTLHKHTRGCQAPDDAETGA